MANHSLVVIIQRFWSVTNSWNVWEGSACEIGDYLVWYFYSWVLMTFPAHILLAVKLVPLQRLDLYPFTVSCSYYGLHYIVYQMFLVSAIHPPSSLILIRRSRVLQSRFWVRLSVAATFLLFFVFGSSVLC